METRSLKNWEEFETIAQSQMAAIADQKKSTDTYVSTPLFRGQSNVEWLLETTLERYTSKKEYTQEQYHRLLLASHPAVATFTGKDWGVDRSPSFSNNPYATPPSYDYMAYLRHHGFPSPLLDWSRSPFVAAFFAYRNAKASSDVSIYMFVEYSSGGKGGRADKAWITGLGPNIDAHKRHFIQQSEYTICTKAADRDQRVYCCHEEVFDRGDKDQDVLTKYILPSSERLKVLSKLDMMNINAHTLFGNEDSLMETIAFREIERNL